MLILLPSDVQGRGNALIISSRVPLKENPVAGGGGRLDGVLKPRLDGLFWGTVGREGEDSTASGSDRDGTGCVCLTPLN